MWTYGQPRVRQKKRRQGRFLVPAFSVQFYRTLGSTSFTESATESPRREQARAQKEKSVEGASTLGRRSARSSVRLLPAVPVASYGPHVVNSRSCNPCRHPRGPRGRTRRRLAFMHARKSFLYHQSHRRVGRQSPLAAFCQCLRQR